MLIVAPCCFVTIVVFIQYILVIMNTKLSLCSLKSKLKLYHPLHVCSLHTHMRFPSSLPINVSLNGLRFNVLLQTCKYYSTKDIHSFVSTFNLYLFCYVFLFLHLSFFIFSTENMLTIKLITLLLFHSFITLIQFILLSFINI